ncbi:MAG: threonine synthase [Actinobacteria bacterium]|nr:threonine synthase [Actinomycetota bacterium]
MAKLWRGVITEYFDRLDIDADTPIITLGEGGTALVHAPALAKLVGAGEVWLKVEGMNPTGSFKDRGMTMAVSKAVAHGAKAVICASTGNTSASAAAYAAKAGIKSVVLIPEGKITLGKLAQAIAHKAEILQVQGNFDDCLVLARDLSEHYAVHLVNSVNPDRLEGQKTASFEVFDALGFAPDYHVMPVGNAGNYSAYFKGYLELQQAGQIKNLPKQLGFQAEGAAPFIAGHPIAKPETIATAIRIGNPASWDLALNAQKVSGGEFDFVTDQEILSMHRWLSNEIGVFVEPSSATGAAGLLKFAKLGKVDSKAKIVITVTGHGLKDVGWALKDESGNDVEPTSCSKDAAQVAELLGLERIK